MDLQEFLQRLENNGDLRRIKRSVDTNLEVAALARREFVRQDGKAILFEQVQGSPFPLTVNLFGSARRMSQLLRCRDLEHFTEQIEQLLNSGQGSAVERLRKLSVKAETVVEIEPRYQYQVLENLSSLPALKTWPLEAGRYFTLPLVITKHPQTGTQNLGIYRGQIIDEQHVALNFSPGSGAAEHLDIAHKNNSPLPVALVFGSDPALYWLAAAPIPAACDELAICRRLFSTALTTTACVSQPLNVPVDAEFVIEGEINPGETCFEGPFGNHTGCYVTRNDCPLLRVTSISCRDNAIMPATVVGPPPSENIFLAKTSECLLRQMLKIDFPQIIDLQMPEMTIFHGVALLSVQRQNSKTVKQLVEALWADSPLQKSKLLILLDSDIDLQDFSTAYWRLINRIDEKRIYRNGKRLAIDATGVDPKTLVVEDEQTVKQLRPRFADFNL
ncbi:MAG: UbiD family decarboxylase [Desulfuromonadaceae bacterium]|nr:UbiD family decarboxylase [Desulfuromonadaceae bacterium]